MSGSEQHLLRGVTVLDLSPYLPGPYASRLLCDLGARVIKVEAPQGDPVQQFMPGTYEFLNRGKQVLRVDLKNQAGVDTVLQLVEHADVVIEAFRPGVVERLGVDYDAAAARNPRIVYCSISSHGQSGPARDRVNHNLGFEAAGGAYAPLLAAGHHPTPAPIAIADTGGGCFSALTICAALVAGQRGSLNGPLHLDVSLEEVISFMAVPRWGRFLRDREAPGPDEIATRAPGMGLYRTRDDRVLAVAAVEDHLWKATCSWLGLDGLTEPPYDTYRGRMQDRDRLDGQVTRQIRARTAGELLHAAQDLDVPVELARTYQEVADDEHLRYRQFIRDTDLGYVMEYPVQVNGQRSPAQDRWPNSTEDTPSIVRELGIEGPALDKLIGSEALPDLRR